MTAPTTTGAEHLPAAGAALFILAIALAGVVLDFAARAASRRALPQYAVSSPRRAWPTAAAAGLLCGALAWHFGPASELPAYLFLAITAVELTRIDLSFHILPNRLVGPLLGVGLVLLTASAMSSGEWPALLRGIIGLVILFVCYFILALISPNGIGMGDVKLSAPLGLYLGYLGWPHLFYGGALGFVAGGVAAALLVLKNRGNKPKEVAFGPSMLAAALAVILLSA
ncbi:prepilin peptidase [Arthrobacter sp. NPDC057259]|uniref:prepilin peptidase n=1 Tax=Arthrobacter sp. NPDC057259 TaxID=3346073 RepID=UPI0036400593